MGYGKIHESMFTGSMMGCGPLGFAVWTYVVTHTKPPGVVELNSKLIAVILGTTEGEVEGTIEWLCSPDPKSRTKDHEGRRLLRTGQFSYSVPTHEKYRDCLLVDEKRRNGALRARRYRARKKKAGSA